jgi:long-chain acyl-CoA synthetase
MMRLIQLIDAARQHFGERIAVVDGERALTYAELHDRVGRAAGLLKGLGIETEDRVCILSLNSHRNLETLFGTVWAGGIAAPLNYRLSPAELAQVIAHVEARVLLVDEEFLALGQQLRNQVDCLKHLILMSDAPAAGRAIDYEAGLAVVETPPDAMRGGGDIATIFFTGGTTGLPKGVMQTHDNLVTSALMYVARWGYDEDTILLGSAAMFHVAAAAVIPPVLMVGGRIVLMPRFDPADYAELIERHRVTFANGVPTMFKMILDTPGAAGRDLSSVLGMNYGGAPMPIALLRQLVNVFPNCRFYCTYGMTEVTSAATVSDGVARHDMPDQDWEWTTIGWPVPLTDVAVLSGDDRPCAPGEVGEIVMRGPQVMKGYWKNPEATEAALRGGWLRSGDLGYADERGHFFLVDRLKDMIISGGENVYSTEVEAAIRELPAVSDVAVIGLPHEKWGESVHAVVVPWPGAELSEQQVIDHCRASIAGYKSPRSVEIRREALPLSGAGKIAKNVLREDRLRYLSA